MTPDPLYPARPLRSDAMSAARSSSGSRVSAIDDSGTRQIGAPQLLLDTCVLLYDHLPAAQLTAHLAAVESFTAVRPDGTHRTFAVPRTPLPDPDLETKETRR